MVFGSSQFTIRTPFLESSRNFQAQCEDRVTGMRGSAPSRGGARVALTVRMARGYTSGRGGGISVVLLCAIARLNKTMPFKGLAKDLARIVGEDGILWRDDDLMLYEYDGLSSMRQPDVVVFPRTTDHVVRIVKLGLQYDVPLVARGAGTGLSGGSVATEGGILLGFSRMKQILEIDLENQRARVQPGVVNLDLSLAVVPYGYYYVPDPSSQKACTLGGNVAENSGGPHTLAYGVTTNHVLGLEMVLPDGSVIHTGARHWDRPGYDLTGLIVGSEGTLGIVTEITVRLCRK